jgi:hypothetical protein
MMRKALVVIVLILLTGCIRSVRTEVTRFNQMPLPSPIVTLSILPLKNQSGDLEFAKYAGLVHDHLAALGYSVVDNPSQARYLVSLAYAIDGRLIQSELPVYGQTGGGTTYETGSAGGSSFSGTAYTAPTFGVIGATTITQLLYSRGASLLIIDPSKSTADYVEQIFRATAVSSGSTGSLPAIMPYLIKAIFKDFPGKNGETITVTEKLETQR